MHMKKYLKKYLKKLDKYTFIGAEDSAEEIPVPGFPDNSYTTKEFIEVSHKCFNDKNNPAKLNDKLYGKSEVQVTHLRRKNKNNGRYYHKIFAVITVKPQSMVQINSGKTIYPITACNDFCIVPCNFGIKSTDLNKTGYKTEIEGVAIVRMEGKSATNEVGEVNCSYSYTTDSNATISNEGLNMGIDCGISTTKSASTLYKNVSFSKNESDNGKIECKYIFSPLFGVNNSIMRCSQKIFVIQEYSSKYKNEKFYCTQSSFFRALNKNDVYSNSLVKTKKRKILTVHNLIHSKYF